VYLPKAELRQTLLTQRRRLSKAYVQEASAQLCKQLLTHKFLKECQRVVAYSAIDNELDLSEFIKNIDTAKHGVYYPKYIENHYQFVLINSNSRWINGHFRVAEPQHNAPLLSDEDRLSESTLWLVPGIGFNADKHRLGYGKGIYDRALEGTDGPKLGCCYEFQHNILFQSDPHDVAMTDICWV
jgi:5-formyltetrahydrofolate cyclo-ligase